MFSHLLFSTTIGQITVLIADATLNNYMDRLSMLKLYVIIRFISYKGKICNNSQYIKDLRNSICQRIGCTLKFSCL